MARAYGVLHMNSCARLSRSQVEGIAAEGYAAALRDYALYSDPYDWDTTTKDCNRVLREHMEPAIALIAKTSFARYNPPRKPENENEHTRDK